MAGFFVPIHRGYAVGRLMKLRRLRRIITPHHFAVKRQHLLRLSREQRRLADFTEAERERVAKGEPALGKAQLEQPYFVVRACQIRCIVQKSSGG